MKGNKSRLVFRQPYLAFFLYMIQGPQADLVFLPVKSPDIPEKSVFDRDPLQEPDNRRMHMVDQRNIDHIIQLFSKPPLCF